MRIRILAVWSVALLLAPSAAAKVCASVSVVPKQPRVGRPVQVVLRTWLPTWSGGRALFDEWWEAPVEYAIAVRLTGPTAKLQTVPLTRSEERTWEWTARVVFPRRGSWTIWPDQRWTYAPPSCKPQLRLSVR